MNRTILSTRLRPGRRRAALLILSATLAYSCVQMPKSAPVRITTDATYRFDGGEDMTLLFDMTATYADAKNKTVSERIASLPWQKTVRADVPFPARLEVRFARRSDIPQRNLYRVGYDGSIGYTTSDGQTSACLSVTQGEIKPRSGTGRRMRFRVRLPDGTSPAGVRIEIPPLKFDKRMAFTYTADDAVAGAYARIWRRIQRKWIDDREFFHMGAEPSTGYMPSEALTITDGCGVPRRFGFGVAIWPTWPGRIQQSSVSFSNIYVTWEELQMILDFGGSVYFHNVNETKYDKTDPQAIRRGLAEDNAMTLEKLGRKMKILALPDGNRAYLDAALADDAVAFVRTQITRPGEYTGPYVRLNGAGPLYKERIYSGYTDDTAAKLAELAAQCASDDPYWVCHTTHRPSTDILQMLETIYKTYGAAGTDDLWVASYDEIYEYRTLRDEARIEQTVDGRDVVFDVTLPDHADFFFPELSFLVRGAAAGSTVEPLADEIVGLSYAPHGDALLVNVNLNAGLPGLAERYTARYERSGEAVDREDAEYFVSLLRPELAAPLRERIEHRPAEQLTLRSIALDGGARSTSRPTVEVSFDCTGTFTHYRIGETADLTGLAWTPANGTPLYTLSSGYGTKTVYAQLKNGSTQTAAVSASILYRKESETETIGPEGLDLYLERLDGYKQVYQETIRAK